jgi:hypothetical protein
MAELCLLLGIRTLPGILVNSFFNPDGRGQCQIVGLLGEVRVIGEVDPGSEKALARSRRELVGQSLESGHGERIVMSSRGNGIWNDSKAKFNTFNCHGMSLRR